MVPCFHAVFADSLVRLGDLDLIGMSAGGGHFLSVPHRPPQQLSRMAG